MIDQITIHNFRGFSSLHVSGLKRVNLIVGKNATGKTAFLESIFMAAGASGPNVAFVLRTMRQLGSQLQLKAEPPAYQSLWSDLFHWFEQDKTISIEIIGNADDSRAMRIWYSESSSQFLPFGTQPPPNPTFLPEIIFEWKRRDESPITVIPKMTSKGLEIEGASVEHFPAFMFGPHIGDSAEEIGKRFSELSKDGRSEPILEALKTEHPFLDSLSIEYSVSTPVVFASFKGNRRKLPVALISDGINKLLGILLGIASFPKGSILIDQIEDGFYFDRMPSIWRTIYRFAQDNDAQIFATTHSMEFLNAMRDAIRGHEEDFALLHAQRENGSCSIRTTKGKFLVATLEQGFEIR
jgi:hypothetical protein